ncbi:MAG: hypothetical protein SGILL_000766 [Bacillariaceae sp.]
MDKATRKMLLVKLVKNEMVSALTGEPEEPDVVSRGSADDGIPSRSADMFYAMMNGETATPASSIHEYAPETMHGISGLPIYENDNTITDDDRTRNTFDQRTFDDLVFAEEEKPARSPSKRPSKKDSRRVVSNRVSDFSVNSLARTNSLDDLELVSAADNNSEPMDNSPAPLSPAYRPALSDSEAGLSVREVEEFVMANMPKHVMDQIPKEAWSTIFGNAQAEMMMNNKPKLGSANLINEDNYDEEQPEDFDEYVVDDDFTEVSEITSPTFYRASDNGLPSPKSKRDRRWESDDAPPDLVPTGWASDSHSASEDPLGEKNTSNHTRIDFAGKVRSVSPVPIKPTVEKEELLKVSFDTVDVRYYERILDLNPAVTNGAAIGIGWRYKRGGSHAVEDWESKRGPIRDASELVLPRHVRESLLKDLGYTQQDIATAVRSIFKAKNKRKQTVQNLGTEQVEEAVETAARRVKNILSLGMRKGLVKSTSTSRPGVMKAASRSSLSQSSAGSS